MALTQERLKELLHYDQATGLFERKLKPSRRNPTHRRVPAGSINCDGYVVIGLRGKVYKGHRLAWLWMTGSWPDDQVDHTDLVKSNNRWSNLRAATNAQNQANTLAKPNNRTGLKGAHFSRHLGWTSRIRVNGERYFLGSFDGPEQAHAAYQAAACKFNPEFGRA